MQAWPNPELLQFCAGSLGVALQISPISGGATGNVLRVTGKDRRMIQQIP
jgi:hypothetical protein